MFFSNINETARQDTFLVAPLDWGLGHATRCVPLVKELLAQNCRVLIASAGDVKLLMQQEFPELEFIDLPGYRVRYTKNKNWLPLKMLLQVPKILFRIYSEHRWLKRTVKQYSITAVISDNRFGLYHSTVPCVYITHQLKIKTGNRFSGWFVQKVHYWFIKKYSQCWVPDFDGDINVAGELSHPSPVPTNVKYIGCISRFEQKEAVEKKYDLLVIVSGPEPQRSLFENLLIEQLTAFDGSAMLVRGLPGDEKIIGSKNKNLVIKNHLDATEMNLAIEQSGMIISRSGYTTVMDLIKLRKKAILVPTPGQTEQEYLAAYLTQQRFFYSATQQNFSLLKVLTEAAGFSFLMSRFDMEQYKKQITQFLGSL